MAITLIAMTDEEFIHVVKNTLKTIPETFKENLDNVEIVIQDWPNETDLEDEPNASPLSLFGLYRGVPKTERYSYFALPDKITIFKQPILHATTNKVDAVKLIEDTVLHEIGHHFGLSDEDLEKSHR